MKNKRKSQSPAVFMWTVLSLIMFGLGSCGGNKSTESASGETVEAETAFLENQPFESGLYDADYYVVTTKDADGKEKTDNKGHFDGRVFFSLSPEQSAMYVFENGNRTKINYIVNFEKPFEKTDSGSYVAIDTKQMPVVLTPDSANYLLSFERGPENYVITMSQKPRYTGTAVEIMEKMVEQKNKK